VLTFIGQHWSSTGSLESGQRPMLSLRATGGGAYKHADDFRKAGVQLTLDDEMSSMVTGLSFLLKSTPGELFRVDVDALVDAGGRFTPLATPAACAQLARNYVAVETPPSSFLYVSIGSGVSILEVDIGSSAGSADDVLRYRRVGGSSVGGSTFWGLVRLLTSCSTFDEVIRLTESGSSANVDMLVGDIYGGDCDAIGLKSDVIAASFGKISMQREEDNSIGPMLLLRYVRALVRHYEEGFWLIILFILRSLPGVTTVAERFGIIRFAEARAASVAMCGNFRAHDVALSLLRMVSNNIGHIGCMCAQQHRMKHIVFGGSFIRDHPYTIATISSGVRFYSRGAVQALFLRHDGFVGAMGAHVSGMPGAAPVVRTPDSDPMAAPMPQAAESTEQMQSPMPQAAESTEQMQSPMPQAAESTEQMQSTMESQRHQQPSQQEPSRQPSPLQPSQQPASLAAGGQAPSSQSASPQS